MATQQEKKGVEGKRLELWERRNEKPKMWQGVRRGRRGNK